jgi:hypothetical protein
MSRVSSLLTPSHSGPRCSLQAMAAAADAGTKTLTRNKSREQLAEEAREEAGSCNVNAHPDVSRRSHALKKSLSGPLKSRDHT